MIEKHFIGQILWKPSILAHTVLTPEDFIGSREALIFKAMKAVSYRGEPVEEQPIAKESGLKITEIMDYKEVHITSANWRYFEEQILEQSRKFKIKKTAEKIVKSEGDATELIRMFEEATAEVQHRIYREVQDTYTVMLGANQRYLDREGGKGEKIISTGIRNLDYLFEGFKKRRLYYVGARPSQGKSALLMNFMTNTQSKALFFSAESNIEEISDRMLIRLARVNSKNFAKGKLAGDEKEKMGETATEFAQLNNWHLYYDSDLDMQKIRSISFNYKKAHNIEIVFIDYLQLIKPNDLRIPRHEQVAEISKGLKDLTNDLSIPVVCAVQLRRDAENKKPKLSDFSDSTQIERDADVAMMIYNSDVIVKDQKASFICVQKNRDGEVKDVSIEFQPQYFNFQTPIKEVEDEINRLTGSGK